MDRVTTYLEVTSPHQLRPPAAELSPGETIERVDAPGLNRRLYEEIGAPFAWVDRRPWSAERWCAWARGIETWVLQADGEVAGYAELLPGEDGVLIAILGVREGFRGRGLGGVLLGAVLRRGLELADRVWVETNSTDGSHALANYEARGMRVFRTVGG
ncbi:MAG: GNAT family N-acetyltransferase [Actinomycetota bacterium]|nr:GNAT family N-acetyltransferase [Actinomycetota bacterium]